VVQKWLFTRKTTRVW